MSFIKNLSIKLFSVLCSYIKSFDLESGKVQLPEKKKTMCMSSLLLIMNVGYSEILTGCRSLSAF